MRSRPGRIERRDVAENSDMNTNTNTQVQSFTLFFSGADVLGDGQFDALYEAGCDDALFGMRDGAQYGAFDREAASFSEALASAIHDVTAAVPGLRVVRIEPDELVTMAAIAERSGISREYVRLLSNTERGPGGFPAPVACVDNKTRLWHWPDVAHWLVEHRKAKVAVDAHAADLVAAMNAAYDLREHAAHLDSPGDLSLVAQALGDGPFRLAVARPLAAGAQ